MFSSFFYFCCVGLVWLREQILHGGGPAWLEAEAAVPVEPVPNLPHVPGKICDLSRIKMAVPAIF